jgi:pimeloyl-ACP methyl ester carboxylesterase
MIKYWDFDKTYVKKDLVAAIKYIKWRTGKDSFVLGGHSMGGSLAIAYAELIGQENIAGIITIASPGKPMPIPPEFKLLRDLYCDENGHVKPLAPENFDPNNSNLIKLMFADMASYNEGYATEWWLNWYYMGTLNDEPAGVCADLWWGLDSDLHEHWLDPDGYDYTMHMSDITVPFLGVCGIQDEMFPLEQATAFFDDNLLGSTDTTSLVFDGYGHIDLLIGRNAPAEIYPEITEWLNNRFT